MLPTGSILLFPLPIFKSSNLQIFKLTKYKHLFFDLDHTLWDFETASENTWKTLYEANGLAEKGIPDFAEFFKIYSGHNDRMWERFRAGHMKREDLRWKRIWHTLLDFKVYDTPLA